jgi:hypothetical protein
MGVHRIASLKVSEGRRGLIWTYLQWRNNIPNANRIYAGQVIRH